MDAPIRIMEAHKLQRLLSLKEIKLITTLSKPSIYRAMALGRFPKPIRLGPGRVAWPLGEVIAWQKRCRDERERAVLRE